VPRPPWPAPAAKTATTHPKASDLAPLTEPPIDPSNRITTLAIVEESALARARGYDPYNQSAPGPRPAGVWDRKRKRD
jgi:hypothetical protein